MVVLERGDAAAVAAGGRNAEDGRVGRRARRDVGHLVLQRRLADRRAVFVRVAVTKPGITLTPPA